MSRSITTIGIAVAVAVSFLFVGVGAVGAHNGGNDVGVSGHCSDDDGGGGGSVGVDQEDGVDGTDQGEIESIVAGLQNYGEEQQSGENSGSDTCDGGEGEDSYDYLEAHAGDGGENQVQACFSEDTNSGDVPISAGQGDQCENPSV